MLHLHMTYSGMQHSHRSYETQEDRISSDNWLAKTLSQAMENALAFHYICTPNLYT
jgi:hypothetical protein